MKHSLSLAVSLLVVSSIVAQADQKVMNPDAKITFLLKDSSQIAIDSSIQDKVFWQNLIVLQDTSFINFFKKGSSNIPYYLNIASIEKQSPYEYIFVAYCRPLNIDTSHLLSFGYATYHVRTTTPISHTSKVVQVELLGLII